MISRQLPRIRGQLKKRIESRRHLTALFVTSEVLRVNRPIWATWRRDGSTLQTPQVGDLIGDYNSKSEKKFPAKHIGSGRGRKRLESGRHLAT